MKSQMWEEDFGLEAGESFVPDEIEETFDLSLPHVLTMLGPIDPGALGLTLFVPSILAVTGAEEIDEAAILEELEAAHLIGLRALVLVEETPVGSESMLRWIAGRSPVHLLVPSNSGASMPNLSWLGTSATGARYDAGDEPAYVIALPGVAADDPTSIARVVGASVLLLAGTTGRGTSGAPLTLTSALHKIPLALMDAGLSAMDVRAVLIDNPAAVLTLKGAS